MRPMYYFTMYDNLNRGISKLLTFVMNVWQQVCLPFIIETHPAGSGTSSDLPTHSYILIPICIAAAFISIALVKKLLFMFFEGSIFDV